MRIESSFSVRAPAQRVHELLVDLERLVGCVPGAALFGIDEAGAARGGLRVEAGSVTAACEGAVRVSEQDAEERRATLHAEGRDAAGPGSARVKLFTTVTPDGDDACTVHVATEVTASGWPEDLDTGALEEAGRDLLAEMGSRIRAQLEVPETPQGSPAQLDEPTAAFTRAVAAAQGIAPPDEEATTVPDPEAAPPPPAPAPAKRTPRPRAAPTTTPRATPRATTTRRQATPRSTPRRRAPAQSGTTAPAPTTPESPAAPPTVAAPPPAPVPTEPPPPVAGRVTIARDDAMGTGDVHITQDQPQHSLADNAIAVLRQQRMPLLGLLAAVLLALVGRRILSRRR